MISNHDGDGHDKAGIFRGHSDFISPTVYLHPTLATVFEFFPFSFPAETESL